MGKPAMLRERIFGGLCLGLIGALSLTVLLLASAAEAPVADAAMVGDIDTVRSLLKQGADVNEAQGDGRTALHWAAFDDHSEMAVMLLYAGATVDATSRVNGITPLSIASQNGSASMIGTLLAAGADPNRTMTTSGTTPLMLAAASGNADAVGRLLEGGADPNAKEAAHGQTALMFAAALNRASALEVLLDAGADATIATTVVDVIARNKSRGRGGPAAAGRGRGHGGPNPAQAPLLSASGIGGRNGNLGSVARRAPAGRGRRGPRVPAVDTMGGLTPLLFAAREGHFEAVDVLLEAGSDINETSPGDKATPLFIATVNGHFDLAEYLLDRGADPKLANTAGGTPLYAAVNVKWAPHTTYPQPDTSQEKVTYLELMQSFLDAGADPNARLKKKLWFTSYFSDLSRANAAGAAPFWRAAQVSDVAAMRLLMAAGADPEITSNEGVSPLNVATGAGVHGNDEITAPGGWMPGVHYLVDELGADVNQADINRGRYTPLHNAAALGHNEMVQYLVDHGADVKAVSDSGQTVADMANGPRQRIQPFPETIALLLKLGSPFSDNCVSC
jgi:ankyrin repeat protein